MTKIAVVGATGAVGVEVLDVLSRRKFPFDSMRLFAGERSKGRILKCGNYSTTVETLDERCFEGIDIAIFSAGSAVSKKWAPIAAASRCVVVDNSSAFRMDGEVPLIVPEINAHDIEWHEGIIANPNCTTAITLMALYPLHKAFGVKRIIASSYQAVSGAGAKGITELNGQIKAYFSDGPMPEPELFPHQIAFNVFPQVDAFMSSGYTKEEEKMQKEGGKIMHHPDFKASMTCVRVPVYRAHSVSVCAEFDQPVTITQAHEALSRAPGLKVINENAGGRYPTPLEASGQDDCFVGRIRPDSVFENGLSFFVCGDQLLKGAALNAVQIAELLIK